MATLNPMPSLAAERTFFEQNYQSLLTEHLGQVVLIRGQNILGFFNSLPKAEEAAYRQFNLLGKTFLIRPILKPEDEECEDVYQRLNWADQE